VAVPDRDEVVLRLEVRAVNVLALRLVGLAAAIAAGVPLAYAIWPS
jgi:hypothetical protein